MTQQAFEQAHWQAVIDAHPLESHDPAEWLRYGVALLQTIEPGPQQAKEQQQAALAFEQAKREGAPPEAVNQALKQSVLLSLGQVISSHLDEAELTSMCLKQARNAMAKAGIYLHISNQKWLMALSGIDGSFFRADEREGLLAFLKQSILSAFSRDYSPVEPKNYADVNQARQGDGIFVNNSYREAFEATARLQPATPLILIDGFEMARKRLAKRPFWIAYGNPRTGSTMIFNLLRILANSLTSGVVAAWEGDLASPEKFFDIVNESTGIDLGVLKIHRCHEAVNARLRAGEAVAIFSHRDIRSACYSYWRMLNNPRSPFFQRNPEISLLDGFVSSQIKGFEQKSLLPGTFVIKEKKLRSEPLNSVKAILDFMDIEAAEESLFCFSRFLGVNNLKRLAEASDGNINTTGHGRVTYLHPDHVSEGLSEYQCSLDVREYVSELICRNQDLLDSEGYCILC